MLAQEMAGDKKEEKSSGNKEAALGCVSLIVLVCLLIWGVRGCYRWTTGTPEPKNDAQQDTQEAADSLTARYSIAQMEDVSFAGCKRIRARVNVDAPRRLTEDEVQTVAKSIVDEVTAEEPVNALSILMYDTPNTTGVYTLASVDWAPYGDWSRANEVRTGDYSKHKFHVTMAPARKPEPETIGGLSPDEAREAYKAICAAQDKAMREADAKYPGDIAKLAEYEEFLSAQYEAQVRQDYGITEEQQTEIIAVGVEQNWPMK